MATPREATVDQLVPALRVHLEAIGAELTPELVRKTLANLPPDVWRGAALIVGCRPASQADRDAIVTRLVAEYTVDDLQTNPNWTWGDIENLRSPETCH